jgi:hypothetical protein
MNSGCRRRSRRYSRCCLFNRLSIASHGSAIHLAEKACLNLPALLFNVFTLIPYCLSLSPASLAAVVAVDIASECVVAVDEAIGVVEVVDEQLLGLWHVFVAAVVVEFVRLPIFVLPPNNRLPSHFAAAAVEPTKP